MGQKAKKLIERPTHFEIGVFMFFDFGPPFDYYNLYIVRPAKSGTNVERLLFTPPGDKCFSPAKIERSAATVKETVAELFDSKNPCEVPEKELKRELKRCKHCLTFSGSRVVMQVKCGEQTRLIRSDILDRDMFDPRAGTPDNTTWTMHLLEKLNKNLGPGVMEKPALQMGTEQPDSKVQLSSQDETILGEVDAGHYDSLFPSGSETEKLSALYKSTQNVGFAQPSAKLKSSSPVPPVKFVEPGYPPLARATHTEGDVSLAFEILPDGSTTNVRILSGHKLLNPAALDAAGRWKFSTADAGKTAEATIGFALNCPTETSKN